MPRNKSQEPTFYERFLLHYVKAFTINNKSVFQNNKNLADAIGVTEASISTMISRLIKNGYLNKSKTDGIRHLTYTGKEFKEIPVFSSATIGEINSLKKQVKNLTKQLVEITIEKDKIINELKDEIENLKAKD